MTNISRKLSVAAILVLGGLSLSACATQEYVDHRIAEVNTRIDGVDAKASAANQKADAALAAAQAAQATANAAEAAIAQTNQRVDTLTTEVNNLEQRPAPRVPRG